MTNTYENEEFNKKTHHIKNIFFIFYQTSRKHSQAREGEGYCTGYIFFEKKKRSEQ